MKYWGFLLILFAVHTASFSQLVEICNNGIDDDHDGFIDCYDGSCANSPSCAGIFLGNDANCQSIPPQFPKFTMALDFASPDETTNHLSRMVIGDYDRDGMPEIATMNRYTNMLYILNGNNGSIKYSASVNFEPYWEIATANIDNDNCAELFFIGYLPEISHTIKVNGKKVKVIDQEEGIYMFAYDCQLNFLWRIEHPFPQQADPINYGIADFDSDGQVEIYAKDEIYDAKTGTRLIVSTAADYQKINGGPVAVNMLGDTNLELVIGLNIYQVNLNGRTKDSGSLTLLQGRNDYFIRDEYNATSVADYNLDGFLDVMASGSTIGYNKNTTVFYWDVKNNTIKTYSDPQPGLGSDYTNGWKNGTGRLNVADLDGDGKMNVSYVSGRFLYALNENFGLMWRANINEETSGYTGCTLFDFNGDGKAEIVYRDERFLYIINGTDGTNYQNPQPCISRTNREYPIVADVDADGSTEICVTCGFNDAQAAANFNTISYSRYSHVRVFKSANEPWVPARRVWNQHGYFVVNVMDDLTIPRIVQAHQLVWSTGSCTQGPNRPLNKFLNQSPYLNSKGCPTYAAVNLTFSSIKPVITPPTCPDVNFSVSLQLTNLGDLALTGNVPISFYTSNPKRPGATKLTTIMVPLNDLEKDSTININNLLINGTGSDSLYLVLNDAGTTVPTPISLPNGTFFECDYTDNIYGAGIHPKPVTLTALEVSKNNQCSTPANGAARAFVPNAGGVENTTDYNFYWFIGNVAKPIASANFVGPIYSGIPDGTYTVFARHKTSGCNSDTVQVVVGVIPGISTVSVTVVSNQTVCNPPNGQLTAVVAGGNAGYTFDWYDISLNPLGINGPTANNLVAGNYLVIASKNGCSAQSNQATVSGPVVPDAQAKVLLNVTDCSNPNSGSVQADAVIGGVVQNPAGYTFDWYFYNNATSTRGSILPPADGIGQIRTGLAAGYYQAVIKDNVTQCISGQTPIVQVIDQTVLPSASIAEVAPQTSCDPLHPNGILTATAASPGLVSPTDFAFEWFKGDNTLPANKVLTVSGTKGETLNQVSGGGIYYTVKVTTALHCSATAKYIISENTVSPVLTLTQLSPNSVCDAAKATSLYNGSIKATVTFGGTPVTLPDPNYSFTWYNGPTVTDPVIAVADPKNPILSGLKDGTYTATVQRTDLFCTAAPKSQVVSKAIVLPALSLTSTGSNNCLAALTPDGTATASITNSVPTDVFGYQWYDGNTVGVSPLGAANNGTSAQAIKLGGPVGAPRPYTVLVTNKTTGCENNATQSVADNSSVPILSFAVPVPNSICSPVTSFNGSLTAQINNIPALYTIADYTFKWYDGPTNASPVDPSSTTAVLSGLDAGFYTVDAKNTKTGCQSTSATNQVPNSKVLPVIQVTSTGSHNCSTGAGIIPDGTATATVTNGPGTFSYSWSAVAPAAALTPSNNPTQQTAIQLGGPTNAPNSYKVVVTNTTTGCAANASGPVADISSKPTFALTPFPNSVCDAALISPGPGQYNGHEDISAVVNNAGTYAGPVTLKYKWYNVDPITSALTVNGSSTTTTLTALNGGKYAADVTIAELGCVSDPVIAEVLNNPAVVVPISNVVASTNCAPALKNGKAEVTAPLGASFSYEWYNGGTVDPLQLIAGATNPILGTNLQGTATFTVRVTNKTNGCQGNTPMTVPDNKVLPTISLGVVSDNTNCSGTPSGKLLATVLKGGVGLIPPYTISWTGTGVVAGVNNEQFTQLAAASYSATVTETSTGCQSAVDTKNIVDNFTYPVITVIPTDQTSCNAATPNGKLKATATVGGVAVPVTFTWFDGVGTGGTIHAQTGPNTGIIDQLASSTNYTVDVKANVTGCDATQAGSVADNVVLPVIDIGGIGPVTSCNAPNGSATVTFITPQPVTYDVFYVFTSTTSGASYPTDPLVIQAGGDPHNLVNTGAPPAAYTGMQPGYLSSVIIDKTTNCTSAPVTKQIPDNTTKSTITVTLIPTPGTCGGGLGGIDPVVTSVPAVAPGSYSYQWYVGSPTNPAAPPINFFDNIPTFSSGQIYADNGANLGINHVPSDPSISVGTYTLVVKTPDGCGTYHTDNVPTLSVPKINVAKTDITDCTTPNGKLDAFVSVPGLPNVNGYSLRIYEGNNNSGALLGSIIAKPVNTHLIVSALPDGPYFLELTDEDYPTCPIGQNQSLVKLPFNPLVAINIVVANTSCDPTNAGDGKVKITVTKDASDTTVPNYDVFNIDNPTHPSYAFPVNIGASGSSITLNGFEALNYVVTVRDNVSHCSTDVNFTIPNQQDIPDALNIPVTPETMCANLSNGKAVASLANAEPTSHFDFTWAQNSDLTSPVYAAAGNGAGTLGELLNQTHATAGTPGNFWPMGAAGSGSGNRTFYAQAERFDYAPGTGVTGVGCKTGIVQVVIPDQHVSPDMTLTPVFNSFCSAVGGLGDGKIMIAADADPGLGGQQNPAGGFDYAWTNANGALSSPQLAQGVNFAIPQLFTGTYQVTATNATNKCQVVNSATINPAPFAISVTASTVIDQRICNFDGQINLTQITVDESAAGLPNIVETNGTPLTASYDFKWYKAAAGSPGTFNPAPGQELEDAALAPINAQSLINGGGGGQYSQMGAGTYYVVATRKNGAAVAAGCAAMPYRVDVKDVHQNPLPTFTTISNTSCLPGLDEGEIQIKVTDNTAILSPFTYAYTWTGPGPVPLPNPGSGNGDASSADGDNDQYKSLIDGTYNVTVKNNQTGCQTVSSATINKNATPVFVQSLTTIDQVLCGPDGSITVTQVTINDRNGVAQVSGVDFPMANFQFAWTRTASAFTQTTAGTVLDVGTYNAVGFGVPLGFDTYTVTAKRVVGSPGAGCQSAPFTANILDKRIFPVPTIAAFANTSCDVLVSEGSLSISVVDNSTAVGAPGFTYTWSPGNPQVIPAAPFPATNNGNGSSADGDEDNPLNLKDGTYNLSVLSNKSGCASNATGIILNNSTPVIAELVTATDQILCNADGKLVVTGVTMTDVKGVVTSSPVNFPLSDFTFRFDRTSIGNTVLASSPATQLDVVNYPAIGFDSYYVVATRAAGSPGRNCSSAPFKVDIKDSRAFPLVAVTSIVNSSCNPLKANGSINANASETSGANAGPYTFVWTLNGGALAPISTQTDTNNSSAIMPAPDGTYQATVTNTVTSCPTVASSVILLDQVSSTPNIIDVSTIDPLDCNPSAQAEVTKITLGGQSNSILFPPQVPPNNEITGAGLLNFNYTWYQGGTAPSDILPSTTKPCIGPGCPSPTAGLTPGVYFVAVQDPNTDCVSGPKEVDILNNKIIYPVVTLTQTLKQISCMVNTGTAELSAAAQEQNGTVGAYNFAWYPSLDLTGTAIAAPSTTNNPNVLSNLLSGNYSVEVQNTVTSCKASALYIVPNDIPTFTPVMALSSQPQTLCTSLDGFVEARVVDIDPTYPFPLSYTADLYFGSNPNLGGAPDVPSMPQVPGFIANFLESGLPIGIYTVRITDNNTQCIAVDTVSILDKRKMPVPVIDPIAPVTNCDPARPNGVASVTVDGTVVNYQFDWYEGSAVAGVPVYTGAEYGSLKPVQYTILATNLITGCTGQSQITVPNGILPIPVPNIDKLSDVTSCIADNGSLASSVGADKNTKDYIFDWYNGSTETASPDFVGELYDDLPTGTYSVTATSRITGCKSPLISEVINKVLVYPDFDFRVISPTCANNNGYATLIMLSNVPVLNIEWENGNGPFQVGPNLNDVVAGTYTVTVTSMLGCATTKDVEIKPEIRPFNGISRNGDGRNDFFQIDCIENFPNNIVKIYNRAGTLVYEANYYDNKSTLFDGQSNRGVSVMGTYLPDGTYFYIVDKRDGSKPVAGYLELVN